MRYRIATCIVLLTLTTIGCGGKKDSNTKSGTGVPTNGQKSNTQKTATKKSQQPGGGGKTKSTLAATATLPKGFPADVATIGTCMNVTKVKNYFQVLFHVKGKSVKEIVQQIEGDMTKNGWKAAGSQVIKDTNAILAYKNSEGRTCGYIVTGFVLDKSAKKDETTKGVTIQTKAK